MKIKFKGMKNKIRSGCPVCGRHQVSNESFVSVRTFTLPSGLTKTFRAGNVYEVNDNDGKFLLQYNAFERI